MKNARTSGDIDDEETKRRANWRRKSVSSPFAYHESVAKSSPGRASTPQKPSYIKLLWVSEITPTRKMKLNSKRFCLGDLISFDFS